MIPSHLAEDLHRILSNLHRIGYQVKTVPMDTPTPEPTETSEIPAVLFALPEPQTAYYVDNNQIVPLQVVRCYTEQTGDEFLVGEALYLEPDTSFLTGETKVEQYPAAGTTRPLCVDPSARGNPFEHQHVAWSLEEAAEMFRQRKLKRAAWNRGMAEEYLSRARAIEATDYHKRILGHSEPETYVSPFTGKRV